MRLEQKVHKVLETRVFDRFAFICECHPTIYNGQMFRLYESGPLSDSACQVCRFWLSDLPSAVSDVKIKGGNVEGTFGTEGRFHGRPYLTKELGCCYVVEQIQRGAIELPVNSETRLLFLIQLVNAATGNVLQGRK